MTTFVWPKQAVAFYRDKATGDTLANLLGRWMDEREYENIADYLKPFTSIAKRHKLKLVGMSARPFGVKFSVAGSVFMATLKCSGQYRLIRVGSV